MSSDQPAAPELTFPDVEAAHLRRRYRDAPVILEFGSGGSTYFAASQPDKFVLSVESDQAWATDLQRRIDEADLPSPAIVYHVDIGPTGEWGRPVDQSHWDSFYRYPTAIWSEPFFRAPDLILIDGRFRAACLVAAYLRIEKPTIVLFDDYVGRQRYHVVENLVVPVATHGRLAEFRIEPGPRPTWLLDLFDALIGDASSTSTDHHFYETAHDLTRYPFNRTL